MSDHNDYYSAANCNARLQAQQEAFAKASIAQMEADRLQTQRDQLARDSAARDAQQALHNRNMEQIRLNGIRLQNEANWRQSHSRSNNTPTHTSRSAAFLPTKFEVVNRDGSTSWMHPDQWYVDWDALWFWGQKLMITAAIVATPFLLYTAWNGFTGFLKNNITYVYGHRGTITLNGHTKPADRIASGELVDHGFWSPARHLLNIPAKFQLTKSAVITGNLKNVKVAGPGLIKIEGDVDNSTVLAGKGFVYIRGSVRNGSDVEGYDVKVLGTRSADSAITSSFDWKRNPVASR